MKNKISGYIAMCFTLIGETLLVFAQPSIVKVSYMFFIIGNIIWLYYGLKNKLKPVILLNIIFIMLGTISLINWSSY